MNSADAEGSARERGVHSACTQTDGLSGQIPRLSKVNLFTLLSLWMEIFPSVEQQKKSQVKKAGLVVVKNMKIVGLHCSSQDLHAGQIALIKYGSRLQNCDLYFSRKPCSMCLKMIVNAGVNRISYWPADPEISLQYEVSNGDAKLDAKAVERLKSNSRAHVCVLLQPLICHMMQFVEESCYKCDFIQKIAKIQPGLSTDFYTDCRQERIKEYERLFLISSEEMHKQMLIILGLENLCENPYFSNLRQNMKDLVLLLATIAASVPSFSHFGFYCNESELTSATNQTLPQEIARHCMVQARLLAYRTEDHKTGVGAVIWAEANSGSCDGTGALYFIGCGYNAFPVGSEYADFPHMDDKQKDREIRKFRYIIHAEQNALTFRCQEINPDERSMIFVTKCPCDECVPLIKGAGIKLIYAGDIDVGKKKADISYMKFAELEGVGKFTWQLSPFYSCAPEHQTLTDQEIQKLLPRSCWGRIGHFPISLYI
ncbi:cytidine and dCMP deaminase domain-containing protein 1 isoform X2 [Hemicordylus capensis]|uniref:cytidine and dCMP deaminase domain-containing protein 1 isoform X2 n=1 Tax=Hemicordylus capensis TaxID=884348 RepID=UPI0023037485|nr:cytidine and dCMP deaminase domain-containing protein 1 isoform X2 [Hemicordylus capensis]XP_053139826.1 cytidine and dCMP deaminase domain-containing protein 1 isoform X2 [Hemicordylus capensis]XP_053139827.1 cytidine and dCMP deaminase domain-containing protein 1 isoform X2 [Hemicordylus capensis]